MRNKVIPVPFTPEHLEKFKIRQHEQQLIDMDNLCAQAMHGFCWSMFIGDEIAALVGFRIIWKGVAEVYIVPAVCLPDHAFAVIWALRKYLNLIAEQFQLRRMHTFSKVDDQTDKWMSIFGFSCEGTLKGYTENEDDYRIWARIKQDGT